MKCAEDDVAQFVEDYDLGRYIKSLFLFKLVFCLVYYLKFIIWFFVSTQPILTDCIKIHFLIKKTDKVSIWDFYEDHYSKHT